MYFDSVAAALAMEGHGPYVWSIALATLLIVIGLLVVPVLRSRRYMVEQRGVIRREQARHEQARHEQARQEEESNAPGA